VPVIGVALSIPEPWAAQLQDYRIDLDPAAALIPTHITLVPPTEIGADDLETVEEHLAKVAESGSSFDVHLRGTGTFRPVSPVVFVGVVEGISQCEQLEAGVRQGRLVLQRTFPYHPHVTVAHHLPEDQLEQAFTDLEDFDATFDVHEMWMYLHDDVSGWQPTQAFPLGS
jgi:2'-5' RNA ligase